jgi:hypothetical protein
MEMDWESPYTFDAVNAFKPILEGSAIHNSDCGKFLVLLLLMLACDSAVGAPDKNGCLQQQFFKLVPFVYRYLFQKSTSTLEMLQQNFPRATMHFNHFIQLHDYKSINKESLLLLMTRGASVLRTNNYISIDTVNVFLQSGMKLSSDNLGLILYQIKNDTNYMDTHN